ncbi:MAG: hypothetical protein Q8M08_16205 [Bacteroidales bacterium]|nr:hypothetical protein [Bacteroidales bacterium]
MNTHLIEFQYFDGCPNADGTLQNLREVMAELGISETQLKMIEVPSIESAETLNFQGSPSILLNGKDIYSDEPPIDFSYTCRIYMFDGVQTGVIPKEFIRAKLKGR